MNFDPNFLYYKMVKFFADNKSKDDKVIICNEGSSRSSKTWDFFHFLVTYCDHNRNKNKDIYILRDSLINCKDFTLKEFIKCMNVIGIPCNIVANPKPYFNLFGNNIYFRGLDDEKNMEGFPSHVAFVNEALEIHKSQIDGILMRCNELFVMDWNPKYSEHWAYDFEKRPNCLFTHSTYKNNKHLPQQVISEIESYNPEIEKNIINKTADKYRWDVYGLGKRASQEGLVYTKGKDYDIIKEIPKDAKLTGYGIDFGYNDPNTLIARYEYNNYVIFDELIYITQSIPNDFIVIMKRLNVSRSLPIYADCAKPEGIEEIYRAGFNCKPIKNKDIVFGIGIVKQKFFYITERSRNMLKELENYAWEKDKKGGYANMPCDKFNHTLDANRYISVGLMKQPIFKGIKTQQSIENNFIVQSKEIEKNIPKNTGIIKTNLLLT